MVLRPPRSSSGSDHTVNSTDVEPLTHGRQTPPVADMGYGPDNSLFTATASKTPAHRRSPRDQGAILVEPFALPDASSGSRRSSGKRPMPEHAHSPAAKRPRLLPGTINYYFKPVEAYRETEKFDYAKHEALPKLPCYHEQFYTAERLLAEQAECYIRVLEKSACTGKSVPLTKLLEAVRAKAQLPSRSPISVAVMGDTNTGKSTFINMLLGRKRVATQGNGGDSCTQVVTVYEASDKGTKQARARIDFKASNVVRLEVKKHFEAATAYFRAARLTKAGSSKQAKDAGDNDEDDFEGELRLQEYKTARDFFTQLLGGETGFKDERQFEDSMRKIHPSHDAQRFKEIYELCELQLPRGQSRKSRTYEASGKELSEVLRSLRNYCERAGRGRRSLWPLIDRVVVPVDSPFLRQGIMLMDCPGLNDGNATRRASTNACVRDSSIVLVVGVSDRVLNDQNVQTNLNRMWKWKGPGGVILIPTKTDLAHELPENPSDADAALFASLEQAVTTARDALDESEDSRTERAFKAAEANLNRQISLHKIEHVKHEAKFMLDFEACRASPDDLKVIPVSSHEHGKYLDGVRSVKPASLRIDETGIGEVRGALCHLTNKNRYEDFKDFAEELVGPIQSIFMLLTKSTGERRYHITELIDEVRRRCIDKVRDFDRDARIALSDTVLNNNALISGPVCSRWANHVSEQLGIFQSKHPHANTLLAFCRRYGKHSKHNEEDWNGEILQGIDDLLQSDIDICIRDLEALPGKIRNHHHYFLRKLKRDLKREKDLESIDTSAFWIGFERHKRAFAKSFDQAFQKLKDSLYQVMNSNSEDSIRLIFDEAMKQVYDDVERKYPKGAPRSKGDKNISVLRWNHLRSETKSHRSNSPLDMLRQALVSQLQEIFDNFEKEIDEGLQQPYVEIANDMERLLDEMKELGDEEKASLLEQLRVADEEAKQKAAELQDALSEVDHWVAGGACSVFEVPDDTDEEDGD